MSKKESYVKYQKLAQKLAKNRIFYPKKVQKRL